jgi:hypothetical protein
MRELNIYLGKKNKKYTETIIPKMLPPKRKILFI